MSSARDEILKANDVYAASFGNKANLPMPPGRHIAILTCMDARLDPAQFAGVVEGDAHVFRNAGGRATDDAIRSLVISHKLLGTTEWFVIHHTDCGMLHFEDQTMARLLEDSLSTAQLTDDGWKNAENEGGSFEGHYIRWHTISNQEQSVVEDVTRIRKHPLVSAKVIIYGYVFDVKTGKLIEVPEATKAGAR